MSSILLWSIWSLKNSTAYGFAVINIQHIRKNTDNNWNVKTKLFSVNLGSISCENVDLQENLKIFQTIDNANENVTLPSMDDAKKVLKEKCVNVSGSEAAYTRVVEAAETLKECATNLMDIGQLQNDIEEAVPKGELDTVFNK